jgi:predicted RNA-binding protein associated with RNAse of E/G family
MDHLAIFWRHLGREHSLGKCADDLRKNPPEIVKQYLELKMARAKQAAVHRYLKVNDNILLELPGRGTGEEFLICYLIAEGLQFSLGHKKSHGGWLIDLMEIEEVAPRLYCVSDLFIDIAVDASGSYRVLDMEDFRRAVELEIIGQEQMVRALRSFDFILHKLNTGQFPLEVLRELVKEHAPTLAA